MKNNKVNTIAIIITLTILTFFGLRFYFGKVSLKKDHKFTIGLIYSYSNSGRSGPVIEYRYDVKGKEYTTIQFVDEFNKSNMNERFFVKYSPSNPVNSDILLEEKVPSNLNEVPPEGWKEIPR